MTAPSIDITILVDNQAAPDPVAEHGLSLWIRTDGRHILFDTGQGPARPANAEALGINLRLTDQLALSHGHRDHTGGPRHCTGEAAFKTLGTALGDVIIRGDAGSTYAF